jgi:hypothetical protein
LSSATRVKSKFGKKNGKYDASIKTNELMSKINEFNALQVRIQKLEDNLLEK